MLGKSNMITVSLSTSAAQSMNLAHKFHSRFVRQLAWDSPIYSHQSTLHISISDPEETKSQQQLRLLRILDYKPPRALMELCWTIATAASDNNHASRARHRAYRVNLVTPAHVLPNKHATEYALLWPFRTTWWGFRDVSFHRFTDTQLVSEVHAAVTGLWMFPADMIASTSMYLQAQQDRMQEAFEVASMISICRETANHIAAVQASTSVRSRLNPITTRTNLLKLTVPWAEATLQTIDARLRSLIPFDSSCSAGETEARVGDARQLALELATPSNGLYDILACSFRHERFCRRAVYALAMASAWAIIGGKQEVEDYVRMFETKCYNDRDRFDAGMRVLDELRQQLVVIQARLPPA